MTAKAERRPRVVETDLGRVIVAYLEALGAVVYQEVEVVGGIADIVARVGAELWIIEVKTSLSLALLIQAMDRRRLAHRVIVAAPYSKNMRDVARICEELGIGLWRVYAGGDSKYTPPEVREVTAGRRWNRRPVALAKELTEEHRTHGEAGAVGAGGRWTPFRDTCAKVARVVSVEPGITLKDAIARIKHHYSSAAGARASIAHWAAAGKIPGVELRDGKLYPVGTVAERVARRGAAT